MTSTRSQTCPTTVMSWLMNSSAMSPSAWIDFSSRSTWRWTVTSSAVVGSSAITSAGSPMTAIPIMARCRIPPDSSCGNCLARCSGRGIRTARSRSTARAPACRLLSP